VGAADDGQFAFKIKARGVMDGIEVERDAIVRYQNNSSGYVYGPMQLQRSQLTITSEPAVILGTPDVVPITPGGDGKLKISVRRFGATKGSEVLIRAKQPPATVTVIPVKVPGTVNDAQLVVSASPQAVSSPITLEVVSPVDGRPLGESAPFLIEVKSDAKEGK
jgi:hypothetical protein